MNQQDLFGADEPRERLAQDIRRERGMKAADKAKESRASRSGAQLASEGMERVAGATERALPGWSDRALDKIHAFAKTTAEFTAEDVKHWAYANGLDRPPNESAWGPVMKRAASRRWIALIGYRKPQDASRHCSPNRLWKRTWG